MKKRRTRRRSFVCLSLSRPGERRDPYAATSRWCDMAADFCGNERQGLWVPAFAGTTAGVRLRGFRGLFRYRAGIEALGVDVAVDEFDHGHRGVIAIAKTGLDDAGIAALAVLVAGGENVEQLFGLIEVAHLGDRLPPHGETALLAERDQLLHDRAQFLRLRQRGDDLLVLDQRRAHIGEHRAPVLGGAIELAMNLAVTHGLFLNTCSVATARRTCCAGGPPAFAPSFRGAREREPGIS